MFFPFKLKGFLIDILNYLNTFKHTLQYNKRLLIQLRQFGTMEYR